MFCLIDAFTHVLSYNPLPKEKPDRTLTAQAWMCTSSSPRTQGLGENQGHCWTGKCCVTCNAGVSVRQQVSTLTTEEGTEDVGGQVIP